MLPAVWWSIGCGTAPPTRLDIIAAAACACPTLACAAEQHHALALQLGDDTRNVALWRVTRCIDWLADAFLAEVQTVTDDLCACTDRACYDALAPRVSRVFSAENVANVGPEMVERLTVEVERFNGCDARFATGPDLPSGAR